MFQFKLLQDAIWPREEVTDTIYPDEWFKYWKGAISEKADETQEDATHYVASGKLSPRCHKYTPSFKFKTSK